MVFNVTKRLSVISLTASVLLGCAEKEVRLWIEPPVGFTAESQRNLYYRVEDVQSGKKESVAIPINQLPEDLVVEPGKVLPNGENLAAATKADEAIGGKAEAKAPAKTSAPTLSYLRGLRAVEDLYQENQFEEALIKLAPLIEEYPGKARLFTMRGTLYRQLGEKKLAYLSYKAAHELDENDARVSEAYFRLQNEVGETE